MRLCFWIYFWSIDEKFRIKNFQSTVFIMLRPYTPIQGFKRKIEKSNWLIKRLVTQRVVVTWKQRIKHLTVFSLCHKTTCWIFIFRCVAKPYERCYFQNTCIKHLFLLILTISVIDTFHCAIVNCIYLKISEPDVGFQN